MGRIDKNVPVLNEPQRYEEAWGSGGATPRIPKLGSIERWLVSFRFRLLNLQGKNTPPPPPASAEQTGYKARGAREPF
jgi:hypothetical protein